jgi:cysteine desulfurase
MPSTYLDFAATTPVDPRVADLVMHLMVEEFGNAGSRTHEFGAQAARTVENARRQIAGVAHVEPSGVIFTSGATEANNIAILGLAQEGLATRRTHVVTTSIEHKAVLEPLDALVKQGFTVDHIRPSPSGAVNAQAVADAVREDTLLVSVMQVNNETGIRQPLDEIASLLPDKGPFLHTDAAQGFGKQLEVLRNERIDMISVSGHKLYAPKGIGALLLRRRNRRRPPVAPLMFGGGQERGLRPGTLPVPLIAGFGLASELAMSEHTERLQALRATRELFVAALGRLGATINGDSRLAVAHILNASIPGIDSEAAMVALKDVAAISNGSACTSSSYEPSHVLRAMGLDDESARCAIRISWGPTDTGDLAERVAAALAALN